MIAVQTANARCASSSRRGVVFVGAGLALMTCAVFWQVTGHEFVAYDDPLYVTANSHVQAGLTRAGLAWAFGQIAGQGTYWHPVTWLSHMLDCEWFGLNPARHHLMNLLFHVANVLLLLAVLRRLTGSLWKSALVAALFAVHPLQVDTVAWVAERKNLLSTFFLLLGLLAYRRYVRRPRWRSYLPLALCFALGLLCKPVLVMFPLLLLLLDYWPLQRWEYGSPDAFRQLGRLIGEKIPLLAMSLASGLITLAAHQKLNLLMSTEQLPWLSRLATVPVSYVRYLGKTVWPAKLAVFYPHPGSWPLWKIAGAGLLLVAISIVALRGARRHPCLVAGWLWFLVALLPVIGFVQAGIQSIADRFMYIPLIGLAVSAVWGGSELLFRRPVLRALAIFVVAAVLLGCAGASWFQLAYWQNTVTLFEHALSVTRNNALAHFNLAWALAAQGNHAEAMAHYRATLRLQPRAADAHANLGMLLYRRGQSAEAKAHYYEALKWEPAHVVANFQLANALVADGKDEAALKYYEEAVRRRPEHAVAHFQLGMVQARRGQPAEAIQHYRSALRIKPDWIEANNNLAWLLATHPDAKYRDGAEAVRLAEHAAELTHHTDAETLDTLAAACAESGRFAEAVRTAQGAMKQAEAAGQTALSAQIAKRIVAYESGRPCRD